MKENILLKTWNTPHQTAPFTEICVSDFAPALRQAIKESADTIEQIANQEEPPTFDNTVARLEQASLILDRTAALLLNLNECDTNPQLQSIVLEMLPELTRHENAVWMNETLFARVDKLYSSQDSMNLTTEQTTLLELYHERFIRNGVNLPSAIRKQFAANAEELSQLSEKFNQNTLADTNEWILHITTEEELAGLPERVTNAAHEEAAKRKLQGWVFTLQAPSYRPFMTYACNRELRHKMWVAYNDRGNRGNDSDNNDTIRKILSLRLQQANLLGYPNFATYKLTRTMAQNPETVAAFLQRLHDACFMHAKKELDEVTRFAQENGFTESSLKSWDFTYWSEQLKKERYSFDSETLRPYFPICQVLQGVFGLYFKLYGLQFKENSDIQVYHNDVIAYEVYDSERYLGVLYLDLYARQSKRSGAWMTEFQGQSASCRPQIQVVCNFTPPQKERPSLLSFDEVETLMHEMGHAMHGMLSDVVYPSLAGTNVRRDFVEMPSQVMENWCLETEFLNAFARHYETGETIPDEYVKKIQQSRNYLAGWLCLRQINFGKIDMAYHVLQHPLETSPEQFEHQHTTNLLPVIPGTCISTAFTHIFSGGYAAGYYGYKWAEVLDADIFARFKKEGIFNRETAEAFRREILSKGGSEHPAILFRNFMGRDPNPDALLQRSGMMP